jgi:hypothetical protein
MVFSTTVKTSVKAVSNDLPFKKQLKIGTVNSHQLGKTFGASGLLFCGLSRPEK